MQKYNELSKLQVLLDFDWAKKIDNEDLYYGTATPKDTTTLHFPGFGLEAAKLLYQRGVSGQLRPQHKLNAELVLSIFVNTDIGDFILATCILESCLPISTEGKTHQT